MKSHATSGLRRAIAWVGLAALTLFAAHPSSAAWPNDPFTNVRLAPSTFEQVVNAMVPDGAGGAIVVWYDLRSGTYDIYAQRVTASGAIAPGWPANGLAVCTAAGNQTGPVATSDGSGGAIIAWQDERAGAGLGDIYATRVNANGTLHPSWPANGRNLSVISPANNELGPDIVSDGSGGAIVAWTFVFTSFTDYDLYAAHVSSLGVHLWEVAVSAPAGVQYLGKLCSDGAGGAIVAFADNLSGDYDIRAARVRNDGVLPWGIKDVCVLAGTQDAPAITSDGSGGAVIAWGDVRNTVDYDVFAQHLNASGNPFPGWFPTGNAVCSTVGFQYGQRIVSDGGQGAILAWFDTRFGTNAAFATRITSGGASHPGWPANGVMLAASNAPYSPVLASDGAGGAILAWPDDRAWDLYASRLTASGVLAPGWTSGGTVISAAGSTQYGPNIVSDGSGGVILAWTDYRFGGSSAAAFAQRVDTFGQLGNAEPAITRIKDVPGDQGGHVRVDWNASFLDVNPTFGVGNYWIWRQAPVDVALRAVRGGAMLLNADDNAVPGGPADAEWNADSGRALYMLTTVNATAYAWEFIASQPASGFPKYSYVAATTRDSLGVSNPYTPFMVQARATTGGAFWSSAPDSSYSVDNLAPAVPAPFTGALTGGDMHLHWGPNSESDLAGYRLYRGNSAGFVPSPANLVSAQPDTGYVDPGTGASYYKLSAVDIHGNESGFALLSPSGTLDVVTEPALVLALARPAPNPARDASRIDFALPHETRVSLVVHDVAGRTVRTLFDGVLPAGEHTQRWDLRSGSGSAVRAGLYFVRLEADGRGLSQRLVVSGE